MYNNVSHTILQYGLPDFHIDAIGSFFSKTKKSFSLQANPLNSRTLMTSTVEVNFFGTFL